ncbi:MAG: dTDP-glucose 4,6-dehydratase [Candidatus Aquicultor sp.]
MKIFVTGGAGFIGSNFIRYMLDSYAHYEIVNFDKLTYAGNLDNLKGVDEDPRYRFVKADICDANAVIAALKGCDAVVNFAAESHVDRSITSAKEFIATNIMGTQVLLEAVRELAVPRYLQVSTDEVYGSIDVGSFKETDPLEPSSPYSASKASADLLCRSYYTTFGVPVIITRSSNNFGPYQYPEKLIPLFATNLLEDIPVPIYGDGKNVRDWCYVEDNCRGIDAVLHKGETGEIYNIGAGNEVTNLIITGTILDHLQKPKSLKQYVPDRLGHDRRYSIETSKVRALGWEPHYDFATAMGMTIDWYRGNEWWWRPLKTLSTT